MRSSDLRSDPIADPTQKIAIGLHLKGGFVVLESDFLFFVCVEFSLLVSNLFC
jgi:hypothetical protein